MLINCLDTFHRLTARAITSSCIITTVHQTTIKQRRFNALQTNTHTYMYIPLSVLKLSAHTMHAMHGVYYAVEEKFLNAPQ